MKHAPKHSPNPTGWSRRTHRRVVGNLAAKPNPGAMSLPAWEPQGTFARVSPPAVPSQAAVALA